MKFKFAASCALIAGLMAVGAPVFAHHGSATYDDSKAITLKNVTVTKVNWGNPHTIIQFDAKDDKGGIVHWVAESNSATVVSATGWTKNAVNPGDTVTVVLYQAKNGKPVGRVGKVVLPDGTEYGTGELIGDRPSICDKDFTTGGNESAACRPDGRKTNNKE